MSHNQQQQEHESCARPKTSTGATRLPIDTMQTRNRHSLDLSPLLHAAVPGSSLPSCGQSQKSSLILSQETVCCAESPPLPPPHTSSPEDRAATNLAASLLPTPRAGGTKSSAAAFSLIKATATALAFASSALPLLPEDPNPNRESAVVVVVVAENRAAAGATAESRDLSFIVCGAVRVERIAWKLVPAVSLCFCLRHAYLRSPDPRCGWAVGNAQ